MVFQKPAETFSHYIKPLMMTITFIGGCSLLFMMLLVACDVVLRFFNRPISGAYELVEYSMAITVSFGVTICAHQGGHIAVDILTNVLKKSVQRILATIMTLVAIIYTLPIMWMTTQQIQDTYASGLTSAVLRIAVYPFTAVVALAFLFTSIVFIADILKLFAEIEKKWIQ